jgi:hypothetical protein
VLQTQLARSNVSYSFVSEISVIGIFFARIFDSFSFVLLFSSRAAKTSSSAFQSNTVTRDVADMRSFFCSSSSNITSLDDGPVFSWVRVFSLSYSAIRSFTVSHFLKSRNGYVPHTPAAFVHALTNSSCTSLEYIGGDRRQPGQSLLSGTSPLVVATEVSGGWF